VRMVISRSRQAKVAGCIINDGKISRNSTVRLLRKGQSLYDGPIQSLRRFQEDVREVATGLECGIVLVKFDEFEEGDVIESHRQETVPTR